MKNKDKVINYLKQNGPTEQAKFSSVFGWKPNYVSNLLNSLQSDGKIRKEMQTTENDGSGGKTCYNIISLIGKSQDPKQTNEEVYKKMLKQFMELFIKHANKIPKAEREKFISQLGPNVKILDAIMEEA